MALEKKQLAAIPLQEAGDAKNPPKTIEKGSDVMQTVRQRIMNILSFCRDSFCYGIEDAIEMRIESKKALERKQLAAAPLPSAKHPDINKNEPDKPEPEPDGTGGADTDNTNPPESIPKAPIAPLTILRNNVWVSIPFPDDVRREKTEANGIRHAEPAVIPEATRFISDDADTIFMPMPPEISDSPDAEYLRKQVINSGRMLRFTRNISLDELLGMAQDNEMRQRKNYEPKCYRYGLGHGYGKEDEVLTIVMKEGFWENEKEQGESELNNMFLSENDMRAFYGEQTGNASCILFPFGYHRPLAKQVLPKDINSENLLHLLAREVDYNRNLEREDRGLGENEHGMTVMLQHKPRCMEVYPQLDIYGTRDLSMIDRIMVPEHLWEKALRAAASNQNLARLLYKMEGTGKTPEEFTSGREKMARRTRFQGGRYAPNYGYDSFYRAEQEYFRIVLNSDYDKWAKDKMWQYGYTGISDGYWIHARPQDVDTLHRNERDWKIFINPKCRGFDDSNFRSVLGETLSVVGGQYHYLGIKFKIPHDLSQKWRGRIIGEDPNTPKIVVHVNEKTLPLLLATLDQRLKDCCKDAGFGDDVPGPSFARPYGESGLISYKKEYDERRADIAGQKGGDLKNKADALFNAGFRGTNFYIKSGGYDPLLGRRIY